MLFLFILYIISDFHSSSLYTISFDDDSSIPYYIPNIIWTYWDGRMKDSIRYFLHNLKENVPSYNIIFLCNTTILNYIDKNEIPMKINSLKRANQVDYYRLCLLEKFGGVWMDSSIYLKNELFIKSFIIRMKKNLSLMGAFNYLYHPNYHIEVGFLTAPRHSEFIERVLKEMKLSIQMGSKKYMSKKIDEGIKVKSPEIVKYKGKVKKIDPYFCIYVCILTVLQRDYHNNANVELLKAEDYSYKLHSTCHWNKTCMKIKWETGEAKEYPIIKFNSVNRDILTFPKIYII